MPNRFSSRFAELQREATAILRNGRIARYAARGAKASASVRVSKARKRSADLLPVLEALKGAGASSLRALAAGLNERGIPTARGGGWSAVQVQRVLDSASW